jgi:hypothetical protein
MIFGRPGGLLGLLAIWVNASQKAPSRIIAPLANFLDECVSQWENKQRLPGQNDRGFRQCPILWQGSRVEANPFSRQLKR